MSVEEREKCASGPDPRVGRPFCGAARATRGDERPMMIMRQRNQGRVTPHHSASRVAECEVQGDDGPGYARRGIGEQHGAARLAPD
jgi:hypothetical protein